MYFENVRSWQGTAETLTKELGRQIEELKLSVEPPALRTIRSWRAKQLLSQAKGQEFGFRQILEGLATTLLLKKGWTLAAITQVLPTFTLEALEVQIIAVANGTDSTWSPVIQIEQRHVIDLAEDSVVLLAQGILRSFDQVLSGTEIICQNDNMPPELYKAMCKLGRLYIEEGQVDNAACVHSVLERARYSLTSYKWNLKVFRDPNFRLGGVTLIDPDLRVPTSDCSEIAAISGSFGEDNVIENRLYKQLRDATEKMRKRKNKAYTALRELLGRYSLITENQLSKYLVDKNLTPLQRMVIETFFDPVPDIWLIEGQAYRCAHCGTLMRPHPNKNRFPEGRCPIRQCNSRNSPKVSEKLDSQSNRLRIAKPQILTYWTGPAIDELAIFNAAQTYGLNAELYPESDLCDISINGRAVGIDAKSYTSPVSLGLRLNRSIGGLINYRRRIVAISDQLIQENPSYISTLKSTIEKKGDLASLEFFSVHEVIDFLKKI